MNVQRLRRVAGDRRGVALLFVVALLGLFAGIGLIFSLMARVDAQAARNFKRTPPSSVLVGTFGIDTLAQTAFGQLIYDTTRRNSALRGHSLAVDMYGTNDADPTPARTVSGGVYQSNRPETWLRGAFNGSGVFAPYDIDGDGIVSSAEVTNCLRYMRAPAEMITGVPGAPVAADSGSAADRERNEFPYNYMDFDAVPGAAAGSPRTAGNASTGIRNPGQFMYGGVLHRFGLDEDFDAADHNNWFLALERADGTTIMPSFHRPHLVRQFEENNAFGAIGVGNPYPSLNSVNGRKSILRPRRIDVSPRVVYNDTTRPDIWQDLPDINGNGIRGDIPEELDVDTDGDGIKDAIWVYLGDNPQTISGQYVVPLFAFKVIDLDGKANLNTAGRLLDTRTASQSTNYAANRLDLHESHRGGSSADVNPKYLALIEPSEYSSGSWDGGGAAAPQLRNWRDAEYRRLFSGESTNNVRGKWNPQTGAFNSSPGTPLNVQPGVDDAPTLEWNDPALLLQVNSNYTAANTGMQHWQGLGRHWSPGTQVGAWLSRDLRGSNNYYASVLGHWVNAEGYGFNNWVTNSALPFPPDIFPATGQSFPYVFSLPYGPQASTPMPPVARGGIPAVPNTFPVDWAIINAAEELRLYGTPTANVTWQAEYEDPNDVNDSPFAITESERLYRYHDIDGSGLDDRIERLLQWQLSSDLDSYVLAPNKIRWAQREYARRRMRKMITPLSSDLVKYNIPPTFSRSLGSISGSPALSEDAADFNVASMLNRHAGVLGGMVSGTSISPEQFAQRTGLTTNNGLTQFGYRFPLEVARGMRYDLNHPLRAYTNTAPLATPPFIGTPSGSDRADAERTDMAEQLYVLLWLSVRPVTQAGTIDKHLCRVLAQTAVNIVDFMDEDSVMTRLAFPYDISNPAEWTAVTAPAYSDVRQIVFGFEMPEVVLNEAVAVCQPAVSMGLDGVFMWVELRNPWPQTYANGGGKVESRGLPATGVDLTSLASGNNTREFYRLRYKDQSMGAGPEVFQNLTPQDAAAVPPSLQLRGDDGANQGYYLVGPAQSGIMTPLIPGGWTETWNHFTGSQMYFTRPSGATTLEVRFDLQRLRHPGQEFDAARNPWITVDTVVLQNGAGAYYLGGASPPALNERLSMQRRQPWVGQGALPWNPSNSATPGAGQPTGNANDSTNPDFMRFFGNYLGFPAIADVADAKLWTNDSAKASLVRQEIGFTTDNTNGTSLPNAGLPNTAGRNLGIDLEHYLHFPFLNRPLATPLELLSLRLYGSESWAWDNNTWHQRFTADHEFMISAQSSMAGMAGIYRSRLAPWLDDARVDPTAQIGAAGTKFEYLKTIPDLFRFLEFVDCHSKFRDNAYANYTGQAGSQPEFPRKFRAFGKININTVTEEQVLQALIDEHVAMNSQTMNNDLTPTGNQRMPAYYPFNGYRSVSTGDLNLSPNVSGNQVYGGGMPGTTLGQVLAEQQFPGAIKAITSPASIDYTIAPGRDRRNLVNSEMFRQVLLSRAGADGILGTGDDKPFRSFAAERISDTLLRRRNFKQLDRDQLERFDPIAATPTYGETVEIIATQGANTWLPAAGQYVPRLFDPIPDPLNLFITARPKGVALPPTGLFRWFEHDYGGSYFPSEVPDNQWGPFADRASLPAPGATRKQFADFWMMEDRRNQVLAKMGGNVTTRSNVFAVWVTVGFFRVEPGTQTLQVPLLNEEVGIDTGSNVRHRFFAVIDRTRLRGYGGPTAVIPHNPTVAGDTAGANEDPSNYFTFRCLVLPERIRVIE